MKSKSLVSIDQCSKEDILRILDNARKFEENPNRKLLEGKVAATLFFEPSTRTRLSFETAVNRLGGRVIGFSDASTTSSSKGETLKDTILMVSNYVDLIIMRHHLEGAARYASEVTDDNGNITDVTVDYSEGYVEQMLRYSKDYSPLPSVNN